MYCAKTSTTAVSGNCCPKGYYWLASVGACRQAAPCGDVLTCPNPKSPWNIFKVLLNPLGMTSFWETPGCFFDFTPGKPHEQACVTTDIYGIRDKYYMDIKVLDVNGKVVSPVA